VANIESAILRYRDEVDEAFTIQDCEDDGPFKQFVAKVTIEEVTKLNFIDLY
jgi:hypothetical protein